MFSHTSCYQTILLDRNYSCYCLLSQTLVCSPALKLVCIFKVLFTTVYHEPGCLFIKAHAALCSTHCLSILFPLPAPISYKKGKFLQVLIFFILLTNINSYNFWQSYTSSFVLPFIILIHIQQHAQCRRIKNGVLPTISSAHLIPRWPPKTYKMDYSVYLLHIN